MSLHASSLKSVVKSTDIRVAEEILTKLSVILTKSNVLLTKLSVISPAYSSYFNLESTENDAYETILKIKAQK